MNMNCCTAYLLLIVGGATVAFDTSATTIHTWTDANGVTHFSDSPPPDERPGSIIEYEDDYPSRPDTEADYYSIANQWQRLKAERDATEARRLEREKLRAEERARLASLAAASQPYADGSPRYPVYPLHYGRSFWPPQARPGLPFHQVGDPGRHFGERPQLRRSSNSVPPGAAIPPARFIRQPRLGQQSSAGFHVRF